MHALKGQKPLGRCVISYIQYALKGQKLLAQGNALGILMDKKFALKGQKLWMLEAFALSGRFLCWIANPGCCPGLGAFALSGRP